MNKEDLIKVHVMYGCGTGDKSGQLEVGYLVKGEGEYVYYFDIKGKLVRAKFRDVEVTIPRQPIEKYPDEMLVYPNN